MGKPNKIRIKSKRKISKTKSNEHSDYDEIDDELEDDFIEEEKEISSKWYEEVSNVLILTTNIYLGTGICICIY